MSISTISTKDSYAGNNSIVTQYPITFKYFEEGHISVYFDGVLQTKGAGADYVMGGNGTTSTGYITTNVAQAGTVTVTIVLDVPLDQPVALLETGLLPAKTIEVEGFDRLNMQVRRVWRKLQDVLTFNTDEANGSTGTADNLIGFDGSGDIAEIPNTTFLQTANDLSDVDAATARTNLGVDPAGTRFALSELTDATITNPVSGETIEWNGSAWVNSLSNTQVDTSDTAPVSPNDGDLWYDSTSGLMYVYYNDGSSSQWVTITSAVSSLDASSVAYTPAGTGAVVTDLQTKARESVSVKDFGAVGDGVADDTTEIQAAIDAVNAAGGGALYFPAGTYRVEGLQAKDKVECIGVFGAVTLKVLDGVDGQVFYNPDQSSSTTVDFFSLSGFIFDGNKSSALGSTATSVVTVNGTTYFSARDCIFQNGTGYGLGLQSYVGESSGKIGDQSEIYLENCHFLSNGDGVGGDTFDGLDVKWCDNITIIGCIANNNQDKGFDVRGTRVSIEGCSASGNAGSGFEAHANQNTAGLNGTINITNCEANGNGGAGFAVVDGIGGSNTCRANLSNIISYSNLYGLQCPTYSTSTEMTISNANIFSCTNHGIRLAADMRACIIQSSIIRSNTGSGIYNEGTNVLISNCQLNLNSRYGYEEGVSAQYNTLAGATRIKGNTLGVVLLTSNKRTNIESGVRSYNIGSGDVLPSATTLDIPLGGSYFVVTGTTDIDTITPTYRGHAVTLQFSSTGSTLTDSTTGAANLALATDFVASSADVLSLVCDGTNWYEVSRSNN